MSSRSALQPAVCPQERQTTVLDQTDGSAVLWFVPETGYSRWGEKKVRKKHLKCGRSIVVSAAWNRPWTVVDVMAQSRRRRCSGLCARRVNRPM